MKRATVSLRPLTRADLPVVRPWFEVPDTQRFVAGADWPATMLEHSPRAAAAMFSGATQTGAPLYPALSADTPVGCIDDGTLTVAPFTPAKDRTGPSSPRRSTRRLGRSRP
jgi:hypothetical protein